MNPIVPGPEEITIFVLEIVNVVLVLWALVVIWRERKPFGWAVFEVAAVIFVPLVGPGVVLLLRRPRRARPLGHAHR